MNPEPWLQASMPVAGGKAGAGHGLADGVLVDLAGDTRRQSEQIAKRKARPNSERL
jgi:hypothetical protein